MQPLPRDITASVFTKASHSFTAAATAPAPADAARLLLDGARGLYQGIPSLRMTTTGTRELAADLRAAADAALAASKAQQLPGRETLLGWAGLADAAAAAVTF